jgi:hypothetical protein
MLLSLLWICPVTEFTSWGKARPRPAGKCPRLTVCPAPIVTRPRLLQGVRAHHVPSVLCCLYSSPIATRPCPLAFCSRPVVLHPRPVTFCPRIQEQVRAHSHSARAYRKKSAPAACGRRMPRSSIKGEVPQQVRQPFPFASRPGTQHWAPCVKQPVWIWLWLDAEGM